MPLKITTWNINSVRLRIDLVAKFLKAVRPDVLCLQETKCPDDAFPLKRFKRLGYEHAALNGQKGYHGVAVLSRLPFEGIDIQSFCGKTDCRHVAVVLSIISMCPPAATSPTRSAIRNSRTSFHSLTRCARTRACGRQIRSAPS
jgi:exonuclease III